MERVRIRKRILISNAAVERELVDRIGPDFLQEPSLLHACGRGTR